MMGSGFSSRGFTPSRGLRPWLLTAAPPGLRSWVHPCALLLVLRRRPRRPRGPPADGCAARDRAERRSRPVPHRPRPRSRRLAPGPGRQEGHLRHAAFQGAPRQGRPPGRGREQGRDRRAGGRQARHRPGNPATQGAGSDGRAGDGRQRQHGEPQQDRRGQEGRQPLPRQARSAIRFRFDSVRPPAAREGAAGTRPVAVRRAPRPAAPEGRCRHARRRHVVPRRHVRGAADAPGRSGPARSS